MRLPSCVACRLPVVEIDEQFDKLDSYFIEDGTPPPDSAGWWHTSCLRTADVGPAWRDARVRNYTKVRGFECVRESAAWIVLRDPHRRTTLAIGASGELLGLSIGRKRARTVDGGIVVPRFEETFHFHLGDAALAKEIQDTLVATTVYPLTALLASLGVAEKVNHPVALEGAVLRLERGHQATWDTRTVSARVEYGVFVPSELVAHLSR